MTPTERAIARAGLTFEMADVLDDLGDTRRGIAGVTDELCRLRTCRDALIVRAVTLGGPREAIAAVTAFVGGLNAAASTPRPQRRHRRRGWTSLPRQTTGSGCAHRGLRGGCPRWAR
ncbi:hypothetical protein CENDO_04080 [Corynebacterium endometrii]|uniref:Uncharacterized protein n=1 Tax=Corynebacterium endometrii TaxID=2488819 RepID=A0A4P7QHB0_9CORY|nr:hypothetical protein CENDO_04080 [Corynebacterium endometrii]